MRTCPACGTEVAGRLLSCPSCQRLVHADELRELSLIAGTTADPHEAVAAWRRAQALLPPQSSQHAAIGRKIDELAPLLPKTRRKETDASPRSGAWWKGGLAGAGALALLLWKLKALVLVLLTKGKFLLLGLTKLPVLLGMLASFGVYWVAWGWPFALGILACIYIHELGHAAEMKRRGMEVTAMMFIPGLGAYVRSSHPPASPIENARIGLAGPVWGLAASALCAALSLGTGLGILAAIARTSAWINLFNLVPVWQLDGARGFVSLTRVQRIIATCSLLGAFLITRDGLTLVIAIIAAIRCFGRGAEHGDNQGLLRYIALVLAFSAFHFLPVTTPPH